MQIRQTRFMYSSPTDHESALDLWQCMCIIVKMAWWGWGVRGGRGRISGFRDPFFFFLRGAISAERARLSCPPTIVATWLSCGHPGSPSLPHMEAANICFYFFFSGREYLLVNSMVFFSKIFFSILVKS